MLVNDGLRRIKWCSVKLHVVLFLHMCSFWYKRPIYPLNYILKIPGIFSDTRTFYYIYKMFLLVTNACVLCQRSRGEIYRPPGLRVAPCAQHAAWLPLGLARFQAKLVLGQAAANVKIRGRILFAVRGCETILFCTWWYKTSLQTY